MQTWMWPVSALCSLPDRIWPVSALCLDVGGVVEVVDILAGSRGIGVVVGWRDVVDEAS